MKTKHEGIRYKCEICQKELRRKQRLKAHIKQVHEGRKLLCELCPKMFVEKGNLAKHMKKIHQVTKLPKKVKEIYT